MDGTTLALVIACTVTLVVTVVFYEREHAKYRATITALEAEREALLDDLDSAVDVITGQARNAANLRAVK